MAEVKTFFDKGTSTLTYVVWDRETKEALVIDPVWDYDPASSKLTTTSVETVKAYLNENGLQLKAILETHAHADHLSGAQKIKSQYKEVPVVIGARITEVQKTFGSLFDFGPDFPTDGRQFNKLLKEGEPWQIGVFKITPFATPGHTPACMSYVIEDMVFTGDALFYPDSGVGRCDFPGGSAETLFDSVTKKLYTLSDATRTFTGHDYQPGGREVKWESTIGEQKEKNIHLKASTTKEAFVKFRTERDKTLGAPKLLFPSLQVNINAGSPPPAHANGKRYLTIPFNE